MEQLPSSERNLAHIVKEINQMCFTDQELRERNLLSGDEFWDEDIDIKNTCRMKEIVQEIGWPMISKVGSEAAFDAWLLVQHADHDVEFQEYCLGLMQAASDGDVDRRNIAYLEDRIRVNQGRGQIYGTQFIQKDGMHMAQPIEDQENVDIRRAQMGMGPLTEQIEEMYKKYPFDEVEGKI